MEPHSQAPPQSERRRPHTCGLPGTCLPLVSVCWASGRTPTVNLKRSVWKDSCILEAVPLWLGHKLGKVPFDFSTAHRPARPGQWWLGLLSSAAVLLLDARHQLLFGIIIGDGRLPLGSLVVTVRASVGEKHRQRWISPSNSHLLWQPQWSSSGPS